MNPASFKHIILATIITLTFAQSEAVAYWPTTVEENFSVSADPDTFELQCEALAYPDGRTLIAFRQGYIGPVYNIIDKYGEKQFEFPQKLKPDCINNAAEEPHLISDGFGGAIVAWNSLPPNPEGVHAQRLDSLGNLMWGNSAVLAFPVEEHDFDICPDGEGGFFLAVAPEEGSVDWSDLYMQHIDSEGNLLWGPTGVSVSTAGNVEEERPKIAPDDDGGAFVVWEDNRPPYTTSDNLFAQHLSSEGIILWGEDLNLEATNIYFHQVISDGTGGFLVHTNPGGSYYNDVYRVSSTGNILWQAESVSTGTSAKIVPGETGFFYLGFQLDWIIRFQRMDLSGNTYLPTFGSLEGAYLELSDVPCLGQRDFTFKYPYFYAVYRFTRDNSATTDKSNHMQKADINGQMFWGDAGTRVNMYYNTAAEVQNPIIVVDDYYGASFVWEYNEPNLNIWAKHCNDEGRLGGALHLLVDLEPQNPPIQIPPGGGNFQFNVAIEDTYTVESVFDAWIEVTLPNGEDMEILHRDNITIQSNSVIQRPDMIQNVPANAPPGNYIYHLYAGNREYDDVWSEDSFEFVKIE